MTSIRSKRILAALGAVLVIAGVSSASPALADDPYFSNGQSNPNLSVRPFSYNSTWQSGINLAIRNWNATTSPVSIRTGDSNGGTSITAQQYSDTWYGLYQSCSSNGCVYISLNSRTIARDATNIGNFIASVTVHEFGHAFKLGHVGGTSIMNSSRNRNTMTAPSSSDVTNVRNYYPGWPNQ